mmetsp:Transcript_33233/g.52893  ORF Transcript_33233/g.52893 Transcript_33233/m.52893 type:complete len:326 (+) Transcript_33233:66-1043(+)
MVASSGSKRSTNKVPHAQEPAAEEVWMDNLEDAFSTIQDLAESYPYIAMDTLLPGIVVQPTGPFDSYAEYNYQTLKCNVDLTRSLQISITLADADGIRPKGISTWKFNFNYDASKDFLVQDRRDALRLDLEKHETQGIEPVQFGEQLMSSGLVLNEEVKWIVFHGSSSFSDRPPAEHMSGHAGGEQACVTFSGMYNFGYLLQLLTSSALPDEIVGFRENLDLFFPTRCDMAGHLHQLPPGPPLSSRDHTDPLRRPLFCSAHHVLEAFFQLPDSVKLTAFDLVTEQPVAAVKTCRSHNRRCRDDANAQSNLKNGLRAGPDLQVVVH